MLSKYLPSGMETWVGFYFLFTHSWAELSEPGLAEPAKAYCQPPDQPGPHHEHYTLLCHEHLTRDMEIYTNQMTQENQR